MSFPPYALYIYLAALVFCAGAWFTGKGKIREAAANGILLTLTFFVAHFLYFAYSTQKLGKSNPAVAAATAEMSLRIIAYKESIARHVKKDARSILGKTLAPPSSDKETEDKLANEAFETNEKALVAASKADPKNIRHKAKLVVLLADRPESKDGAARIKEIISELMQTGLPEDEQHQVARALSHIYVHHQVSKDEVKPFAEALQKNIPGGWYLDHAMESLYKESGEKQLLETYQDDVDAKNILAVLRIAVIMVTVVILALIGIVNLFIQLAITGRRANPPPDAVGLALPGKTIYAVFITWFALQILLSTGAHLIMAQLGQASKQPSMVAAITLVTYVCTMLPSTLLIYYLALKPNGIGFVDGLKLRLRTSTAGPTKILLSGFVTVCSAIPVVFILAIAAHLLFHIQSSDNPVLPEIINSAKTMDPVAICLFYLTVGVVAPFFEEVLFRGFLYGSLKTKIGVALAMILSAGAFAFIHFDRGGALMLFGIGFVLAFAFQRSRSLFTSMIAHGLWNSGVFTVVLMVFGS